MQPPRVPLKENSYGFGDAPFYVGRHRPGAAYPVQETLTRMHFHTGLELGAVAGGQGNLIYDGATHALREGQIFFIDPMLPHESHGKTLDLIVVHLMRESIVDAHLDRGSIRLLAPFAAVRKGLPPVIDDAGGAVRVLLRAVEEYGRGTPAGRQRAFLRVLDAVEFVCERLEAAKSIDLPGGDASPMAARILQFIRDHAVQEIGMPEITAFAGVSESTIARLCRAYTGFSPIEYRNHARIARALDRIAMTNERVSSIALACGFNNTSQFYRMFRKFTGTVPAAMRRGSATRTAPTLSRA